MTRLLIYFLTFVIGACCASFLTVCAWRWPLGLSITWPGSRCDFCHHALAWYDLCPIISYLILRGHCRYCDTRIQHHFFTSEVIGGLLACCLASQFFIPQIGYLLLILYLLSLVDIFHTALYPVPMVLAFIPLFIDYWPTNHWLSALLIGSTLSVINYFSDGIGTGDIELLTILGLWFGLEVTLSMLLIACLLCLIKYLIDSLHHPVVLALVGRRPIPFVPYISYGVLIVLFIVNT